MFTRSIDEMRVGSNYRGRGSPLKFFIHGLAFKHSRLFQLWRDIYDIYSFITAG